MLRFIVSIVALALASLAAAQPLTTAFTFQGELNSAGSPVTGTYDFKFTLFDAVTGGTQQGSQLCSDNISVSGGKFTVQLDFGAQFTGNQRFVEVQVRQDTGLSCANASGFTVLSPRQSLTASPNAVYSLNAATAASATNATQLNNQPASFYTNAANLSSGSLPDARLSANIPRDSTANTFTAATNSFQGNLGIGGAALPAWRLSVTGGMNVFDSAAQGISLTSDNISFFNAANEDPAYQYTQTPEQHRFFISGSPVFTISIAGLSGNGSGLTNVNAALLGGLSSSAFLQSIPNPLSLSGTTTTGPIVKASNAGTGTGVMAVQGEITSVSISGTSYGGYFTNVDDIGYGAFGRAQGLSGRGVYGQATAATGANIGVYGESASTSGIGVYGIANSATGVTGETTSYVGVRGNANAATGLNYGGYFQTNSSSGRGVTGVANSATGTNYGVYGQSSSPSGIGVYGNAATAVYGSGGDYGGRFETNQPGSEAVYGHDSAASGHNVGVHGQIDNTNGYGVFGESTSTVGTPTGVFGSTASTNGSGVYGSSTASTGVSTGVDADCMSTSGIAVHGVASAGTGLAIGGYFDSFSASGRGVQGFAPSSTGTTYGVYGFAGSSSGFGVFASGNSGASGTKSFRIDHPADPANKYLLHYSAESPEVLNIYRGTVRLDNAGEALIDLPPYFAAVNKDPSYTLTAVGAPMPLLHVDIEISEDALAEGSKAQPGQPIPPCSFHIAGGAPGAKVSWRIEALRNDRWVQQHGAPVEVDKQDLEKGTYQHPDLYNQPLEKGMNNVVTPRKTPNLPKPSAPDAATAVSGPAD